MNTAEERKAAKKQSSIGIKFPDLRSSNFAFTERGYSGLGPCGLAHNEIIARFPKSLCPGDVFLRVTLLFCAILSLPFLPHCTAFAETVYQSQTDFLKEAFPGSTPTASMLYFTGERRQAASKILGHRPAGLRTRYWHIGKRSAWILEEIGKVKPITVGIIIQDHKIEDVRILIYRESHGAEVRHNYFTKQFVNASLEKDTRLSNTVDGISGATLSVSAVRRLARLALYLEKDVVKATGSFNQPEKSR